MTIARSEQIDLSSTPHYHIMTRCVRRSYLCGTDSVSGKDYSHRKLWLVNKVKNLTDVFSIKIHAYAIMSNHYHLVLQVNSQNAEKWSDDEVIARWKEIFPKDAEKLRMMTKRGKAEGILKNKIALWRDRLMNISWFMRCINEPMARISNLEDNCTGRFWEGRFKSQALLDEAALLSAMVYVDLNPIRAKMALTPEESEFTSIQERIRYISKQLNQNKLNAKSNPSQKLKLSEVTRVCENLKQPPKLGEFASKLNKTSDVSSSIIDFNLSDYLQLVDETGRLIREGKRGAISDCLPPILERLNLNAESWTFLVNSLEKAFSYWVGQEHLEAVLSRESRGLKLKPGPWISKAA